VLRNGRTDNRSLTDRTESETANAKGVEKVSNEIANPTQKSWEYHKDEDWTLEKSGQTDQISDKKVDGRFEPSRVAKLVSFRSILWAEHFEKSVINFPQIDRIDQSNTASETSNQLTDLMETR
jgi:hypothetical protein